MTEFIVTDKARNRIEHLLSDEPAGTYFRIAVLGGGCSGFQYKFDLDQSELQEDDRQYGSEKSPVVVDTTSLDLMEGSQLDYKEQMVGSTFEINNPNAESNCGCGNSFAL